MFNDKRIVIITYDLYPIKYLNLFKITAILENNFGSKMTLKNVLKFKIYY